MILQFNEIKSALPRDKLEAVARDRRAPFRDVKGLVQVYYLERDEADSYGSVMIWEDRAAMEAHRASDLPAAHGQALGITDADVRVYELLFSLRDALETGRGWMA